MRLSRHITTQPRDFEDFRRDDESALSEHRGWSQQAHAREQSRRSAGEEPAEFEGFVPRWWPSHDARRS